MIMSIFTKLFSRNPPNVVTLKVSGKVHRHDCRTQYWGHTVTLQDNIRDKKYGDRAKVVGWLTPIAKLGDEVIIPMNSGRACVYRILEIENQNDPNDMFFATLGPTHYLDEENHE